MACTSDGHLALAPASACTANCRTRAIFAPVPPRASWQRAGMRSNAPQQRIHGIASDMNRRHCTLSLTSSTLLFLEPKMAAMP